MLLVSAKTFGKKWLILRSERERVQMSQHRVFVSLELVVGFSLGPDGKCRLFFTFSVDFR